MKPASTPILAAISTLPVIVACALLGATEARAATCLGNPCDPYVVTIDQVGPNVVATGSGEFDLSGLTFLRRDAFAAHISPQSPALVLSGAFSSGLVDHYGDLQISGPSNFGPGEFDFPNLSKVRVDHRAI